MSHDEQESVTKPPAPVVDAASTVPSNAVLPLPLQPHSRLAYPI